MRERTFGSLGRRDPALFRPASGANSTLQVIKVNGMPLFEFACQGCGETFETLVRADEAVECPSCGSAKPEKLLSAIATPRVSSGLPIGSACPPSDAPPCSPHCCRLPG